MQPEKEEKSLIRRIRLWNDRKAADELIGRYYREIYAYTYRQTLEKQLAMDLTQEIFISVLQSLGNYDAGRSSFRTWLYRIASRRVADYFRSRFYRQRKLTDGLEGDVLPPQEDTLADRLEEKDSARRVLREMEAFDGTTQQILRLKLFADMNFRQIAQIDALPESTVKSRYYAAVKKIQTRLEGTV